VNETFETCNDYVPNRLEEFAEWLDDNIAVEYEINEGSITIFDITPTELNDVMKFESKFRKKYIMGGCSK